MRFEILKREKRKEKTTKERGASSKNFRFIWLVFKMQNQIQTNELKNNQIFKLANFQTNKLSN